MGIETAALAAYAAVAAAGVGAVATVMNGQAQKKTANAQAQQALNAAAYEADAARAQAEKIRRAGRAQQGQTAAALAGAGVKLGEGTPLELQKDIAVRVEEDALSALLTGKRITQSGSEEASMLNKAGQNAQNASVLSAAGQVAGGWAKYNTASNTSAKAA